jgi:hypothetical protein
MFADVGDASSKLVMLDVWLALPLLCPLAMGLFSGGSGPLRGVGVEVTSRWFGSPAERVVEVQFWRAGECFETPPGTVVSLNGTPLQIITAGRKLSDTTRALRVQLPVPNCEPALFRTREAAAGTARVDRVEVEMSGKKASVEIEALLVNRSLRVATPRLEGGQEVTLEWLPRSDVWPKEIIGPEVRIEGPGMETITVAGPALRVDKGRFQFRLPAVRPGRVTLSVHPGAKPPTARVARCRGFAECRGGDVPGPPPVEAEVMGAGATSR